MKKYRYLIPSLLAAFGWATVSGHAEDASSATPAAPVEHHIYLHVVAPQAGEAVRVFVAPSPEEGEWADAAEPVAEPETSAAAPTPEPESELSEVLDELIAEVLATEPETEDTSPAALPPLPPLPPAEEEAAATAHASAPMGLLLFIFVLAIFLGFELISKVPSQLHTPLMSGSNAISGITIVGALAAAGLGVGGAFGTFLGTLAVAFAAINVVGGYMVTNRMLAMFQKKDGGAQ